MASFGKAAEKKNFTESEVTNRDVVAEKQSLDASVNLQREVIENTRQISSQVMSNRINSQSEVVESTRQISSQVMSNRIFQYLELLHSELKELNAKYDKVWNRLEKLTGTGGELLSVDSYLPPGIELPVSTDLMLSDLNERIKNDSEFSATLIRYLHGLGFGKTPRSFILSIMKKVITSDLAVTYSRTGRKGKKSFSNYPDTLNVILAAASTKFKLSSREELADMFSKCLAGASEWNGRKIRPSDISSLSLTEL